MRPYHVSSVRVDDDYLRLVANGVEYWVRMDRIATYSDRLLKASREQRARYEVSTTGIHWPDVGEDLSIRGLIRDAEKAIETSRKAKEPRRETSPTTS